MNYVLKNRSALIVIFISLILNLYTCIFSREITLLMIGLDNAGKTCTVKHLLGGKIYLNYLLLCFHKCINLDI